MNASLEKTNNDWLSEALASPSVEAREKAEAHQATLTKPPGALGQLENIAIQLASLQNVDRPAVDKVSITVFAADHGIAKEGISAFPQEVTAEMVKNFANGGAAISVLAKQIGATLEVVNLGTINDPGELKGVINNPLGAGTANFVEQAAMSDEQLELALAAGKRSAEQAKNTSVQLYIGGEMGIGNTSSATALACVLLNESAKALTGPGTGINANGVALKIKLIEKAISLHKPHISSPLEALRRVGGFEIAALAGAYVSCAKLGMPVLIDGFISSSAALVAQRICSGTKDWFIYAHSSAEPGHRLVLEKLNAKPLIDLQMRLGEGSGAAVAVPLLRLACALHNNMATFAQAQVSEKI